MSAAEERLANDPTSELWGEHRSRYRFVTSGQWSVVSGQEPGEAGRLVADALPGAVRNLIPSAAARLRAEPSGFIPDGNRCEPRSGGPLTGLAVLDVACGAGFGLDMLCEADAQAIGVDYDGGALGDIRRAQPLARLVRGDGMCLPLRDASIDLVVSFETIEHVPDAAALVGELRRVLKPGGRLVLSTPNRTFGPPERHTGNPFHVREFTADELRDLLCASFETVQLFGQRPSDAYRYVPFLMLEHQNEPRALAWKLLVRLPFGLRNRLAHALSGRPFYPGEEDYCFVPEARDGAHALVAVAC